MCVCGCMAGGRSMEESVSWLNMVITLDLILITPISSSHYTKIDVQSTLQLPDTPKGGHLQLTDKILCTGIDFPLHRLSKKRTPLISGQNSLHRRCPLIGVDCIIVTRNKWSRNLLITLLSRIKHSHVFKNIDRFCKHATLSW